MQTHQKWYLGPSFLMFLVLLLVYLVSALPLTPGSGNRLINILTIGLVFFGLRAVTQRRRVLWMGLGLTLVYVLVSELIHVSLDGTGYQLDTFVVLLFFAGMLGVMAKVVMRREVVTLDKIFAAACVYMLMGIFFGMLFVVIEQSFPGSFSLSEADLDGLAGALIHFSFTTLTTVGYGSISPMSGVARALSDVESVIAQLYLAIVVARLVSLQITQGTDFDDAPDS